MIDDYVREARAGGNFGGDVINCFVELQRRGTVREW
jgi:hypothetical protein